MIVIIMIITTIILVTTINRPPSRTLCHLSGHLPALFASGGMTLEQAWREEGDDSAASPLRGDRLTWSLHVAL